MQYRTPGFVEEYLTKISTNLVEKAEGVTVPPQLSRKAGYDVIKDIYQKNEKNVRGFHTQELSCQIS